MLVQKMELFGIASIGVSTFLAKRNLSVSNTKKFKKEVAAGIALCGIVTLLIPF